MMARLKVFRTPIGFHNAYVAAPSQKAALQAWGSDVDLFARDVAEVVTDEQLIAEPLTNPGKVIRKLRGTVEEQLAAAKLPDQPALRARREQDDAPVARSGWQLPEELRRPLSPHHRHLRRSPVVERWMPRRRPSATLTPGMTPRIATGAIDRRNWEGASAARSGA